MLNHFKIPSKSFNGPVLITGAGGCIGAWTMAMLLKEDIEVIACDLTNNKKRPELLIENGELAKVPCVEGDISDTDYVLNTIEKYNPESIIHLAAFSGVHQFNKNVLKSFVLSHPIAGSEHSGFKSSSADLFKEKLTSIKVEK